MPHLTAAAGSIRDSRRKNSADQFTVECWVNPGPQQSQHADIFGNHVSEGLGFVLQQDGANTNEFLAAYGAGGGRWVMTEAVPLVAGRWQHVALVKTPEDLRFYLNGVLVASEQDAAPARPSPMPVAVGLGYTAQERCFRGLIDEFRIWNKALTEFGHAGIDPAAARETRAQGLESTPRPAVGELVQTWTLATDDTRLTLGVTAEGELVVRELSCPATGWNWIAKPVAFGLWPQADIGGQRQTLRWRLADAAMEESDGRKLTLRFACDDPALEAVSQWHARPGPGPVHHSLTIRNRSYQPVTIGEQPTFDLDLTGAAAMWSFHSDGITPDAVGVYRHPLATEEPGRRYSVRTVPTGEFIPYVVLEAKEPHGVYLGLEWSCCRIEAVTLAGDASPAVRVRAGNRGDLRAELAPGESCEIRPGFVGAYRGDLDDAGNRLRRWLARYRVPGNPAAGPELSEGPVERFRRHGQDAGQLGSGREEILSADRRHRAAGFRGSDDRRRLVGGQRAGLGSGRLGRRDEAGRGLRPRQGAPVWALLDGQPGHGRPGRKAAAGGSHHPLVSRVPRRHVAIRLHARRSYRGLVRGDSRFLRNGGYAGQGDPRVPVGELQRRRTHQGLWGDEPGRQDLQFRHLFRAARPAGVLRQLVCVASDAARRPSGQHRRPLPSPRRRGHEVRIPFDVDGRPEWFLDAPNGGNGSEPWTQEEKDTVKACVATYKAKLRPLVREADLYHILPRPDGRTWDGIQYYDPAAGKGVVYLFKPSPEPATESIRFKGLDAKAMYRVSFEDGTQPPSVKSAAELMDPGLTVTLQGEEASELIFFEAVR